MPIKLIARTLESRAIRCGQRWPVKGRRSMQAQTGPARRWTAEDAIRAQLTAVPTMPATVIAERVGWTRGMAVFKERVRELRPAYLPPDPAGRTTYERGSRSAICSSRGDGVGRVRPGSYPMQLPVLTMVCGYSRWLSGILIPSRRAEDLFAGWWALIAALGAVPRTLVWDGEGAIGRWRSGKTELTADCQGFAGCWAPR